MFRHKTFDVETKEDLLEMIALYKKHKAKVTAFDTETTGLHIIDDKPFLFQWGWKHRDTIYSFIVWDTAVHNLFKQSILAFFKLIETNQALVLGHNVKYDLHMLRNIKINPTITNLSDTQIYIRHAHDALVEANGGPPMSLKKYSARFIDRNAADHEKNLDLEKSEIAKLYNAQLLKMLKGFPNPPEGYKSWTKGALESLFKDVLATPEDLPTQDMRDAYNLWYNNLPERVRKNMTTNFVERNDIPYTMLDKEMIAKYGHKDIYLTLCVYYKTYEVVEARKNKHAVDFDSACLIPLLEMERVGFQIDKEYVQEARDMMYNYMKNRRGDMYNIIGEELSVAQHARVKQIFQEKWGITLESTDSTYLGTLHPKFKAEGYTEALEFLDVLQELRTLEKWYSTYLLRFVKDAEYSDRVYTTINTVGTVSGRVTSDFQQFPKFGIQTKDEKELFNPRRMVVKTPGYSGLVYLDYSQIELRFQALYTILVGEPDKNLCRAYMPYECYYVDKRDKGSDPLWREQDHVWEFDYTNPRCLEMAYVLDWVHVEDGEPWHKTDVHSATTAIAFPELDKDSDLFKKYRGKVGKRVNFAKNYGARYAKISTMFPDFDFSEEKLHEIDDAYYKAFPGVRAYHNYCYELANQSRYATNLFGIRYYGLTGHKLINTLVQGSAAYFLKQKIIEVQNFLFQNKYKTRFQMNIHDELSFEVAKGEEHIIPQIQYIMQNYPETMVPIVADIEASNRSWADKVEAESVEEIIEILGKERNEL